MGCNISDFCYNKEIARLNLERKFKFAIDKMLIDSLNTDRITLFAHVDRLTETDKRNICQRIYIYYSEAKKFQNIKLSELLLDSIKKNYKQFGIVEYIKEMEDNEKRFNINGFNKCGIDIDGR